MIASVRNIHATTRLASVLLVFLLSDCTQFEDKSGSDSGLILQSLLNNSADPKGSCKSSFQEAEDCLSSTNDLSGIKENSLAPILSGGSANSYETYCTQLLGTEELSKFDAKTQECIFSCNESYWSRVEAEGQCEVESSDLISRSGIETLSCIRHCKELYSPESEF